KELRTPEVIESSRSSTPGDWGSMYMVDEEMPSSNSPFRARENADSERVRLATARAEAMPKLSLYFLPWPSTRRSPGDSWVPANQEPTMTDRKRTRLD